MERKIQHLKAHSRQTNSDPFLADRAAFELYQAFMVGYVRRLNEATFNVTIGGIRIGSAKYTRLAQINLQSRIITFSRFAVENVPERGRRYLVLHELAHVKEANHNKRFWGHVERFEPNYRKVSRELEVAFKRNVKEDLKRVKQMSAAPGLKQGSKLALSSRLLNYELNAKTKTDLASNSDPAMTLLRPLYEEELAAHQIRAPIDPFQYQFEEPINDDSDSFECRQEDFSSWDDDQSFGTISGGDHY